MRKVDLARAILLGSSATFIFAVPASALAFGQGDAYSLLIEHEGRRMLVQGSAGYVPGALQGRSADVV